MQKRRFLLILFIAAVIVAAAVVAYAYLASPQSLTGSVPEPFTDGWRTSDGSEAPLPGSLGGDGETVLIRELPEALPEDAVLLLKTNYLFVTASVGGEELFSWTGEGRTPFEIGRASCRERV